MNILLSLSFRFGFHNRLCIKISTLLCAAVTKYYNNSNKIYTFVFAYFSMQIIVNTM